MIDPARVVKNYQKNLKRDLPEIYAGLPAEERRGTTGRSCMYGELTGWDSIDHIEITRGEMLAFCVYYCNHKNDRVLPVAFPHCWYRGKITPRWGYIFKLLCGESLTRKQCHDVNESFARFFGVYGERFSKWIEAHPQAVVARGESYRRNALHEQAIDPDESDDEDY